MITEEAIKVLKKNRKIAEMYESNDVKAYDMAIKALQLLDIKEYESRSGKAVVE